MQLLSGNTIPITGTTNCWVPNNFNNFSKRKYRKKSKFSKKINKKYSKKKFKFSTMDRRSSGDNSYGNLYYVEKSLKPGQMLLAQGAFANGDPLQRALDHSSG